MTRHYSGREEIAAGRDTVWEAITTAEWLGHCLPDVLSLTVHDATHFQAVVGIGLGLVRASFTLTFALQPEPAANRLVMTVSGTGFGSTLDLTARADVDPSPVDTTILEWAGVGEVRGPAASLGGVVDAQVQRLVTETFANVRMRLC